MIWRSTAQLVASFALAALAVWFSPWLLERIGLGEFSFLGQLAAAVIVLTGLELFFRRLPE